MTQETEELQLTDGQTQDLPEVPELSSQQSGNEDFLPSSSSMMTQTKIEDDRYYNQAEFESAFNEFLTFLKSPEVSLDAFESMRAKGQTLAAGKIYNLANKYSFLRWMIDRRTALFHDFCLISIFAACETNAIVMNWTGISLAEKGKLWLKSKIKARQQAAQAAGKPKGWGFLGRRAAEKQPKPENSQPA